MRQIVQVHCLDLLLNNIKTHTMLHQPQMQDHFLCHKHVYASVSCRIRRASKLKEVKLMLMVHFLCIFAILQLVRAFLLYALFVVGKTEGQKRLCTCASLSMNCQLTVGDCLYWLGKIGCCYCMHCLSGLLLVTCTLCANLLPCVVFFCGPMRNLIGRTWWWALIGNNHISGEGFPTMIHVASIHRYIMYSAMCHIGPLSRSIDQEVTIILACVISYLLQCTCGASQLL